MNSVFETVKAAVSVPEAAAYYGMKIGRSRMAPCLFHEDRHPSMRLYDDHYYCFSCHARGDVTDLVSRLLDIAPLAAARKLAADFRVSAEGGAPANRLRAPVRDDRTLPRSQRILYGYERMLRDWKEKFPPASPGDDPPWRFTWACRELPRVENMADCLGSADPDLREWVDRELESGGEYVKMAVLQILNRMEEVNRNGKDQAAAARELPGVEPSAE